MSVSNHLRFLALAALKVASYVIYPAHLQWITKKPDSWDDVSLILILNHTSLFEFLYGVNLPFSFLRQLSARLVVAIADSTLKTFLGRTVLTHIAPHVVPITRKRDESWSVFLEKIDSNHICIFLPEGRMKRVNGLDKDGKKMTVKSGTVDLLKKFRGKKMVLVYGKGLHHILSPGQLFPRFFRKIEAKLESLSVDEYLDLFEGSEDMLGSICRDLEKRRDMHC
ncbi:MAG: hypothetical protein KA436_08340 [Oligoflexales bacterium]|nr:hypothetical protein [Oligoflexales bacterium]